MVTKKKSTFRRIVDTISDLVRQPMSDESNETPTPAAVQRAKAVAAGTRRTRTKARKAKK